MTLWARKFVILTSRQFMHVLRGLRAEDIRSIAGVILDTFPMPMQFVIQLFFTTWLLCTTFLHLPFALVILFSVYSERELAKDSLVAFTSFIDFKKNIDALIAGSILFWSKISMNLPGREGKTWVLQVIVWSRIYSENTNYGSLKRKKRYGYSQKWHQTISMSTCHIPSQVGTWDLHVG